MYFGSILAKLLQYLLVFNEHVTKFLLTYILYTVSVTRTHIVLQSKTNNIHVQ